MKVKELGEVKVISALKKLVKRRRREVLLGIGDDSCLLKNGEILTTDSFLAGVHFDLRYFDYRTLGERITCATLSDIAAMAGKPILILVSLYLPREMERKELLSLYQGIENICRRYNCQVAGGDIVASPKLGITLTALGKSDKAVRRDSARVGDKVFLTGYLGMAETGRIALAQGLSRKEYPKTIVRHLRPLPRIFEAWQMRKKLNSLIDTSDGLSTDLNHLARESKVKIKIFWEKLPIHKETKRLAKRLKIDLKDFLFSAGEDFELLFTSDKEIPKEIRGLKIAEIGKCEKGRGVFFIKEGKEYPLPPTGYDHLTAENNLL
ncbi:MAG: thiamine-phosphate kinase [candidate division WOR-3 bacterium]